MTVIGTIQPLKRLIGGQHNRMTDNAPMNTPVKQPPEAQSTTNPDPRRPAMIGLLLVVALVLGGLFLVHVLRAMSQVQDCAMEGRTNCAPIDPHASGG